MRQAVTWTSADLLLIEPLGRNFSENLDRDSNIFIEENKFENVVCEVTAILSGGGNVLNKKKSRATMLTMGLLPDTQNGRLRMRRERFPSHRIQKKSPVSDPGMHHGTCITHVPWCMSGSLTRGGTFPAFPVHAQSAILRIWQEAHGVSIYWLDVSQTTRHLWSMIHVHRNWRYKNVFHPRYGLLYLSGQYFNFWSVVYHNRSRKLYCP